MSRHLVRSRLVRWFADGFGVGAEPLGPSRTRTDLDTPTYLRRGVAIPGLTQPRSSGSARIGR